MGYDNCLLLLVLLILKGMGIEINFLVIFGGLFGDFLNIEYVHVCIYIHNVTVFFS